MISEPSKTIMNKTFLPLSLLLLMLANTAHAADIQVSVDRNPVGINDAFTMTFTAYEDPDGNPDFSELKDNFEILSQQHGSTSSWINGESTSSEQWILQVMAKHSGDLLIPPVAFGADNSKPISIKVTDDPQPAQSSDDIYLEVSASPEQPYVQSQVLFTVKLFRRVQIAQANLDEPEVKDAVIEKLVEDSSYSTQINNVDYAVTERKYAIFPQQSGLFTIAPLTMVAQVVSYSNQPSFNGFFNRPSAQARKVTSKAITLNVLPAPQGSKSNWLSAESMQLKETWSDNSLQVKVGEPLTRTLSLTAKATTVGQLPELAGTANIAGVKSYPDQPQLREDKAADGLTALRQEKIAYIPGQAGEYTLPAIQIDWFNSKTGQMESSRLPEVKITALAADGATLSPPSPAVSSETPAIHSEPSAQPSIGVASSEGGLFWPWLSAVLAAGWLLTIVWFVRKSPPSKPVKTSDDAMRTESLAVEKTLKSACAGNDPQAAKQALLQWGKNQFSCNNLTTLAAHCPEPLARAIMALNQDVYSSQPENWQGQSLWQAFVDHKLRQSADKKSPAAEVVLEPLYKF